MVGDEDIAGVEVDWVEVDWVKVAEVEAEIVLSSGIEPASPVVNPSPPPACSGFVCSPLNFSPSTMTGAIHFLGSG